MNKHKVSNVWLLKMAWKDALVNRSKLALFVMSILLGVSAVVSVVSFGDNLKSKIEEESKSLMGADYLIDSRQKPNERVKHIMDSLGGHLAEEVNFMSMAYFPKSEGTKLLRVSGFKGQFPIYGSLETTPVKAANEYIDKKGALLDETVMLQFDLSVGDSVKLGKVKFPILGVLHSAPGKSVFASTIAPSVFVPFDFIDSTGLIQTGSRVEYQYYFKGESDEQLIELEEHLDPVLDAEGADLDTHHSTGRRLGRSMQNFNKFLYLVAFISLLLGCVGIASSTNIYLKEKQKSIAVLKCIGLTRFEAFKIYLFQIIMVGFIGGVLGSIAGALIQQIFPLLLSDFLPVNLNFTVSYSTLVYGVGIGIIIAALFALLPLLKTWYVSPVEVLRNSSERIKVPNKTRLIVLLSIILFVFAFAFLFLGGAVLSIYFIVGIGIIFALIIAISRLIVFVVKSVFPENAGFVIRHSLKNLFRPGNQTLVLTLSIGVGVFLISTLYTSKDLLLQQTEMDQSNKQENILLMDVQTNQTEKIETTLREMGLKTESTTPIVTMKLQSINGRSIAEIRNDTTVAIKDWVLNNEYRVTYREHLTENEELLEGAWIGSFTKEDGPIPISIADYFIEDAQVKLGDKVVWNVQGVSIATEIKSIRKINWTNLNLNFTVLFPEGTINNAPQFDIMTTYAASKEVSATLQKTLVKQFPNLTIVDLRQVLNLVESVLGKISLVVNFMAIFSIVTGIIVLMGTIRTTRYQRVRENVLLRTIGAQNHQIIRINALEYFFLGIVGVFSGLLLSVFSTLMLSNFIFEVPFVFAIIPNLILAIIVLMLVVGIGVVNNRSVLRVPPIQILKSNS